MKVLGILLAFMARITLPGATQQLERDLAATYERYHATKIDLSPAVAIVLVAGEDRRFFRHGGVDLIATLRAIWLFTTQRRLSGASTIEQQLVRTLTRRYELTLRRKIREILLASLVDRVVPKSEIPGLYLALAYFGWRMNGIQEASRRLGIDLEDMTLRQAASIVARLKYPEPRLASREQANRIVFRTEYLVKLILRSPAMLRQMKGATVDASVLHL